VAEDIEWSHEKIMMAMDFLSDIRESLRIRNLPQDVYEAHLSTFKKLSTEGVFVNSKKGVYLAQRPNDDVYSCQWHLPGVTHIFNESRNDAFLRLMRDEIGGDVDILESFHFNSLEYKDKIRGMYDVKISIYRITGTPKSNMNGRFFSIKELESSSQIDNLFEFHVHMLPKITKKIIELGWN
jgi:hypothetical protein